MEYRVWLRDGAIVYGQSLCDLMADYRGVMIRTDHNRSGHWERI
jgi:hypothetical protein